MEFEVIRCPHVPPGTVYFMKDPPPCPLCAEEQREVLMEQDNEYVANKWTEAEDYEWET